MLRDQKVQIKAGKTEQIFVNGKYLRVKTAPIPFRFRSKNGDDFEIKQGDEVSINDFEYVYITNESAADHVIDFYTGDLERVGSAELNGNVIVNNDIGLNVATRDLLRFENYGASFRGSSALIGNTPETVFTGAANVNGAIVHSAQMISVSGTALTLVSLLAKATPPVNAVDGDSVLTCDGVNLFTGNFVNYGCLKNPVKIPSGKGLFFVVATNEAAAGNQRAVLYTLL